MLALGSAGPRTALRLEPGRLIVCDGQAERRIDLTALPPDPLGYVLRAEESCDPPTTALDKNGQARPMLSTAMARSWRRRWWTGTLARSG